MTSDRRQTYSLFTKLGRFLDTTRLVFVLLFVVFFMRGGLDDPDYFWHLETGEYIFANQSLPEGDVFSHTHQGKPWVLMEWASEVFFYLVFDTFGAVGVKALTALFALTALWVVFTFVRHFFSRPIFALAMAFVVFLPAMQGITPRPHLFTYLFFSVYLVAILRYKYFHDQRLLYLLPVFMVIWVNTHGAFAVGVALLVLFIIAEAMNHRIHGSNQDKREEKLGKLGVVVALTLLASVVNPDFIYHWHYPFYVITLEATTHIKEWHSLSFKSASNIVYLLSVIVFVFTCAYKAKKVDVTELAIPLFFIVLGFVSIRHMPLAVLAIIPFLAINVERIMPAGSPLTTGMDRVIRRSNELGNMEYVLNWSIIFVCVVVALIFWPAIKTKATLERDRVIPEAATNFLVDNEITGRMYNTYRFGGYLIRRLYPGEKVFIDGRADMYGDEFFEEYLRLTNGMPGWEEVLEKYGIDYVVTDRKNAIRQLLLARGDFATVFDDEFNSVLVKRNARFSKLIEEYAQE